MKGRRVRVVPRLVLSASFVGVVPACVLACGGSTTSPNDAGSDVIYGVADVAYGVAAVAYCCFDAAVADAAFGADVDAQPSDAPADADGD